LERLTKAVVLVSIVAALAFETVSAGWELPSLRWMSLGAAIAAVVIGRIFPERTAGIVVALGAIMPLLFLIGVGHFRLWHLTLWKGSLLGAILATTTLNWRTPSPFRFALTTWALAVALTWPIVALRELDWIASLLWVRPSTPSTAIHGIPNSIWIAQVAQIHLLGVLWADWLFGRFAGAPLERFDRLVVRPMLVGTAVGAALPTYQGLIDLRFLGASLWAELDRASGALTDANASGALSGLWVAIPLGLAAASRGRTARMVLPLLSLLLLAAVWMTGSRTGFLVAVVGLASGLHLSMLRTTRPKARWAALLAVALVAGSVVVVASRQSTAAGPIARARALLPEFTGSALRSAAWELWARNGYGLIAAEMIKDAPLQGVGIGAFHIVMVEYPIPGSGDRLPSDNAQNWYRHQIAELGVLGSVGWIWWIVLVGSIVIRGPVAAETRTRAIAVRYAICGFAAASLLGMAGQSVIVALAFWTLVAWLLLMTHGQAAAGPNTAAHAVWTVRALPTALAFAFTGVTAYAAWTDLRPPFRSSRIDYPYRYGMHEPFEGDSGRLRTSGHAVYVRRAPRPWLKLTAWVEHPDADVRPVRMEVWRDNERVMRGRLPRNVPMTRYVKVPDDKRSFVLESRVDRTFAAADGTHADVGLNLSWEFVDEGPR
jgi:O-Antigen ligase